ncbi:MAG TPA: hypothetical protein VGQ69_07825 [Gemmatimonadales bacterium]|jgi:hypothetical protein|nr:hypothetical protein [Gemmatimonadales bacterium]
MQLSSRAGGLACLGGLLIALATGCGKQEPAVPPPEPLVEFSKRVDEYVALRNRLAEKVGPIDETKSQAEIAARATTLGHLIQTERANAKQGDIFTPDVAALLTAIIQREHSGRPPPVQETREDQEEEHRTEGLPDFAPQVDSLWPTTYPLPTFPPTLLPLLPKLPPEIEYRTTSHYLVLRDIEANLIIDFIPNAVP